MNAIAAQFTSPTGSRDTWAEVMLPAIAHNMRLFSRQKAKACRLMAVVKANAYGHGAVEVARTALSAGAEYLGVALVDEGLQLRESGITQPILVLGYTPPHAVEAALVQNITLTVFTEEVLEEIIVCARRHKIKARIHLKYDTGMSRIGLASIPAVTRLMEQASAAASDVIVEGMFTHFADADGADPGFAQEQFARFTACIKALESKGFHIPIKHCCNSAAAMRFPEMHLDMIRVGIALYGLYPSEQLRLPEYPLQQAMSLKTRIAALHPALPGQTVGYGRTYRAADDTLIATIPIGYADGLSRSLSNCGYALVRGQRVPVIGRICMDQAMLDVSGVQGISTGDEVVMFGSTGRPGEEIALGEMAAWMNTIHYEVICAISQRVPRLYRQ
ncbi:alanine racemase [Paenibacillus senegalimassiliensis]|uniref:alanine racemase n=1 Tax=Paenibacillus senegalimassiliensis TaxID=1737426 RepID=UPI00073E5AEE|nr:alanine racemase [Paenibacillus senegalimassiliensis]